MTATARLDHPPGAIRLRTALLAGLVGVGLAGCTANRQEIVGAIPDDYRVNHPIVLANQLETLDIPAANESPSLSRDMRSNIAAFGDRFMAGGGSVIAIVMPRGSANEIVAARIGEQARRALIDSGVPSVAIDARSYPADPTEPEAPVRLAFDRIAAATRPCGPWQDQLSNTSQNRHYQNFGCASQQNLAAMVANPLDLLYPRRSTPPDAERRSAVLNGYRRAEPFQGDYSREPRSSVAQEVAE